MQRRQDDQARVADGRRLGLGCVRVFACERHVRQWSARRDVSAGFAVCVVLYYVFIKFTPLNWLINGYSKSPLKLKFLGA